MTEEKPWYMRTELWLTLAAIVLPEILQSGLFSESDTATRIITTAIAVLAALGYTASRTLLKMQHAANAVSVKTEEIKLETARIEFQSEREKTTQEQIKRGD